MIVVSDASPLNYLTLLGVESILGDLFDVVTVPPAVRAELSRDATPDAVRQWIANPPEWIRFQAPASVASELDVDPGETEAISLALELDSAALLIDDRKGRLVAEGLGLTAFGTIAVLEKAADRKFVDLADAFARLLQTNFRVSPRLLDETLKRRDAKSGLKSP